MSALQPDLDVLREDVDSMRRWPGADPAEVSEAACEALAAAAARALPSIEALTDKIRVRLLENWPVFAQTAELERELCLTIETNLRWFFGQVIASESSEVLIAPSEALSFAISVQHHGIDTAALIQAYRVGQNLAWSWWMDHLAHEVSDHRLLLEVIERSSERMFAYVDAVVEEQVLMWERERERWSGRLTLQRAEAVRTVLVGESAASKKALRSNRLHARARAGGGHSLGGRAGARAGCPGARDEPPGADRRSDRGCGRRRAHLDRAR